MNANIKINNGDLTETYNKVVSVRSPRFPDWIDDDDEEFDEMCRQEAIQWGNDVLKACLRSMTSQKKEEYLKIHINIEKREEELKIN